MHIAEAMQALQLPCDYSVADIELAFARMSAGIQAQVLSGKPESEDLQRLRCALLQARALLRAQPVSKVTLNHAVRWFGPGAESGEDLRAQAQALTAQVRDSVDAAGLHTVGLELHAACELAQAVLSAGNPLGRVWAAEVLGIPLSASGKTVSQRFESQRQRLAGLIARPQTKYEEYRHLQQLALLEQAWHVFSAPLGAAPARPDKPLQTPSAGAAARPRWRTYLPGAGLLAGLLGATYWVTGGGNWSAGMLDDMKSFVGGGWAGGTPAWAQGGSPLGSNSGSPIGEVAGSTVTSRHEARTPEPAWGGAVSAVSPEEPGLPAGRVAAPGRGGGVPADTARLVAGAPAPQSAPRAAAVPVGDAGGLSVEQQADQYLLRAQQLFNDGRFAEANDFFGRILALEISVPADLHYHYANSLIEAEEPSAAKLQAERYLAREGQAGRFYRDALLLHAKAQEVEQKRLEAERASQARLEQRRRNCAGARHELEALAPEIERLKREIRVLERSIRSLAKTPGELVCTNSVFTERNTCHESAESLQRTREIRGLQDDVDTRRSAPPFEQRANLLALVEENCD